MKRLILLTSLALSFIYVNGQMNLLKDGFFETTVIDTKGPAETVPDEHHVWYPYLAATENLYHVYTVNNDPFTGESFLGIKINKSAAPTSSWFHGVAQRTSASTGGIYRLGFYAKFSSVDAAFTNTYARTFLRVNDPEKAEMFFVRATDNKTQYYDQFFTNEWRYYSLDFNLDKVALGSGGTAEIVDATATHRSEFSVYFSNFQKQRDGDIQIKGVSLVKLSDIESPSSWINPGFEDAVGLPDYGTTFSNAVNSRGIWRMTVRNNQGETKNIGSMTLDKSEFHSGSKSMKVVVEKLNNFANLYLASTLYNLPKGKHVIKFWAKTDIEMVPFRVDINHVNENYPDNPFSATATQRENQLSLNANEWAEYVVEFDNTEYAEPLLIAIRPNLDAELGQPGEVWGETPVTYWFDDFSIQLDDGTSTLLHHYTAENKMKINLTQNSVEVFNVEGKVSVIDLTGRIIESKLALNNNVNFTLQKGIYIIKSGVESRKVFVK